MGSIKALNMELARLLWYCSELARGSAMFIWFFHRISGIALVVLVGIKILTGYFLFGQDKKPDWALSLHRQPVLDVLILVLFTFHSIYGIRTIIMDFGFRNERRLFLIANVAASIISAFLLYMYFVIV